MAAVVLLHGCQSAGPTDPASPSAKPTRRPKGSIRDIACLYDIKPWLNLDTAGDLDPEGIFYRVFLDPGTGKGVAREGKFHVEMYKVTPKDGGGFERTLVSDWHYPSSAFPQIKNKMLGTGYLLRLRWASKSVAGSEIELITRFEDPGGYAVAAGTKRLRIPKYTS